MLFADKPSQFDNIRTAIAIKQSDIQRCPHYIMVPEHYRADETCRCDDPDHSEMVEWGYVWDTAAGLWIADDAEEN